MSLREYLSGDNESPYISLNPPEVTPVLNKKQSMKQYVLYMLNRTCRMFDYDGLPDTIPFLALEHMLQTAGFVIIAKSPKAPSHVYAIDTPPDVKYEGTPYAFLGGLGGDPDPYYRPTKAIVANPALDFSAEFKIGKDCAIIRNDANMIGLLPMYWRFASQMAENDISLRNAQINSRERTIIVADSDRAFQSANEYLKQVVDGNIAAIMDTPLIGNTRVENAGMASANHIIQLIELGQYLKASWYNEVGLNSAFNMKREYLSSEEIAANTDILMPLVDDMLHCRELGVDIVNQMFGTNITVKKASAWESKDTENRIHVEGGEEGVELSPDEPAASA